MLNDKIDRYLIYNFRIVFKLIFFLNLLVFHILPNQLSFANVCIKSQLINNHIIIDDSTIELISYLTMPKYLQYNNCLFLTVIN